jgi:hypothetical protein
MTMDERRTDRGADDAAPPDLTLLGPVGVSSDASNHSR